MLAALSAVPRLAPAAVPEGARLVSSGPSAIRFVIDVPEPRVEPGPAGGSRVLLDGYGTFSPPGAPYLPCRTFNVAVPAGAAATVSWTVASSEDLGPLELSRVRGERFIRYEDGIPLTEPFMPEDPWEGDIPLETVSAGEPAMMGRQRVLPVRVCPLGIENGGAVLARRIEVTVSFDRPGRSAGTSPVSRPQAADAISSTWRGIYGRTLVNPGDVEEMIAPLGSAAPLRSARADGKMLRIKIPETGLYSIRADSLIASGMSPAQSPGGFALRKRYWDPAEPDLARDEDIPYRVVKGASTAPGVFEGDDRLVFYARGLRDDPESGDSIQTFNTYNIIWLVEEEAGSLIPGGPPLPSGGMLSPPPFEASVRVREDTWYQKYVKAGTRDFYFVRGPKEGESAVPFMVRGLVPSEDFSVHVRISGDVKLDPDQELDFEIRNPGGTRLIGEGSVNSTNPAIFDFTGLPGDWLAEGENELVVTSATRYGFLINDFEVRYTRRLEAHDDMLEFSLDQALVDWDVEIPGFSAPGGYLVEITDPEAPVFFEVPEDSFTAAGGGWKMSVTIPSPDRRRFIAAGTDAGGHIYNAWIEVDTPSGLAGSRGPFNTLVISHADFLPPSTDRLAQYVSWREQQGYRILTADVRDVYDEFNGGLVSCDAIRRFVRYGVDNWGVDFVLLVGDASEDHRRIRIGDPPDSDGSAPDYVPTYTYSVNVIGRDKDEVVASDKYYMFLDEAPPDGFFSSPAGTSEAGEGPNLYLPAAAYPDVLVGRIPVGREIELRALLTKMYRYEEPSPDEQWRRSMAVFADDAWSGSFSEYQYNPIEERFESSMDSVATAIDTSLPGGFDVKRLFLSKWTDATHPTQDGGVLVYSESRDSTRAYFTPYMIRALNDGCLLWTFQGHAARTHLCTETAFSMVHQFEDIDSLRTDRNFIFIGVGCHISEFAIMLEYSIEGYRGGPDGDCLTEVLLTKSRSGAVGTYASTGFEYLLENQVFSELLHESVFKRPPTDSIPPGMESTGARWILGEAITAAEIEHLGRAGYAYGQTYRYIILGDPMLRVDPGPPRMKLEADWGPGFEELASDTIRARDRSNSVTLRFTPSDVVALGDITFQVDGSDRTEDLTVTRTGDGDLTWARSYEAVVDYGFSLDERSLTFTVHKPGGEVAGTTGLEAVTVLRLFNGPEEIEPGGQAPSSGEFRVVARFPVWLETPPTLSLDGIGMSGAGFAVSESGDSTGWEASFTEKLAAGEHVLTVTAMDHDTSIDFVVGGSGLAVTAFNFPNPFVSGTNICYSLNLPAEAGRIRIYNVSGVPVREIALPRDRLDSASPGAPNTVWWDGRDSAGDPVANGTYIYVLEIERDGESISRTGRAVRLE